MREEGNSHEFLYAEVYVEELVRVSVSLPMREEGNSHEFLYAGASLYVEELVRVSASSFEEKLHENSPHSLYRNRMDKDELKGGLRRLSPEAYQGRTWVHWSMTIDHRRTGWLNSLMHSRIREALLHALSRYNLICVTYCLMPDHGHFLIGGLQPLPGSDQRRAMRMFRKEWNRQLQELPISFALQKQPHDHVLTKRECTTRETFQSVAGYILENPVKEGLAEHLENWEFLGCLVPGYPDLHPSDEIFGMCFGKFSKSSG